MMREIPVGPKWTMEKVREAIRTRTVLVTSEGHISYRGAWERGEFTGRLRYLLKKGEATICPSTRYVQLPKKEGS